MDASKLTQMRMEAANTYRSNWQGRDASEVTLRKVVQSQASQIGKNAPHQGPVLNSGGVCPTTNDPNNGFSTDFGGESVFQKYAGCAVCTDPNFGKSSGVNLKSCAEVSTILYRPPNPVLGITCVNPVSPEVLIRPFPCPPLPFPSG